MVNGKQFTVKLHVADLTLSHVDAEEVTKMIDWLKSILWDDMWVSRVEIHDYLGMELDFTEPGELKITMIPYLKEVTRDFTEEITGRAASQAAEHLFTARED
jgi:hypothetical protein